MTGRQETVLEFNYPQDFPPLSLMLIVLKHGSLICFRAFRVLLVPLDLQALWVTQERG